MKRGRSPLPAKQASPPHRIASPAPESVVLHIDQLTRNVNEAHLKEIFSNFGVVVNVELSVDRTVNIPRGYGYVEFKTRADAEKALLYMDGAQIVGMLSEHGSRYLPRPKVSPPPKAVPVTSRREAPQRENVGADVEKDGQQRQKESSRRKLLSPPRRRSPIGRRGESPPRRRPASPRRRSPSPALRKNRSPARASPRRVRGSPVRKRSPIPPRRRMTGANACTLWWAFFLED
eukprot:TRINITY_DN5859_c1_g1_i8.p1 TRINITY_DN5859_c1_g1~~TRINITY_DN5859_c1_g1_i8.p1  ORF type:complete len:233 (-),score=45.30 TRINITY_DN5859_c1_g1_i8:586-1284(-)